MGNAFFSFLVILALLAVFTRETFVVLLLYLFVGANLIGQWWVGQVVKRVSFHRSYDRHAFPGETITVALDLANTSLLPAVWLRIQDLFPLEVADNRSFSQVISLGPKEKMRLNYNLKARKRGYFSIGPFNIASGDLLGISGERVSAGGIDHLTVYPRVIPLPGLNLPSNSPLGTLPHTQPIFEDPARPAGKRDYQPGDSLRRIDWKVTASTGRMQTKLFEPSIALDTAICLNLNLDDYHLRTHFDATELAIVAAASLANWIIAQRQTVGLYCNGLDPLAADGHPPALAPRKGRGHLMHILEILARIRAAAAQPFVPMLRQQRVHLPWGTTLIVISGSADRALFDELLQARKSGLNPVLILCGEHPSHHQSVIEGKLLGLPTHVYQDEKSLERLSA